jgi:uncharacterized integral membrane protein
MKSKLILGLIFIVPVFAFVVQNDQRVDVVLFRGHFVVPLALMALSAVLVGIVIGILVGPSRKLYRARLAKRSLKEQKKQQKLGKEAPGEPVVAERRQVETLAAQSVAGEGSPQ